jgi:hypothetical protein
MKWSWVWLSVIVALVFLVLYGFDFITAYWVGMIAALFIILGIIITFLVTGAGATKTEGANRIGFILLLAGIILVLIIFLVPK